MSVTAGLQWSGSSVEDGDLPDLEMAERQTQQTDCQGLAYFGDIYIAEGSGKAAADLAATSAGMEFQFCFSAALPSRYSLVSRPFPFQSRLFSNQTLHIMGRNANRLVMSFRQLQSCRAMNGVVVIVDVLVQLTLFLLCRDVCSWTCQVLFSDDGQRFSAMKELGENHRQLVEQQQSLLGKLECARNRKSAAEADCTTARKAVEACREEVRLHPPLPKSHWE